MQIISKHLKSKRFQTFSEVGLESAGHMAEIPHTSRSSSLSANGLHTPVV